MHLSRIVIENFRNFSKLDVALLWLPPVWSRKMKLKVSGETGAIQIGLGEVHVA